MKPGHSRGSIDDVAREAKVSRSTASRVLRGLMKVLPETQERIFAAAEKVMYRPNVMARALRMGDMRNVALVMTSSEIADPVYGAAITSARYELAAAGFRLTIHLVDEIEDPLNLIEEVVAWTSVVALPDRVELDQARIANLGVPLILLGGCHSSLDGGQVARICFDQADGVRQAVEHLVSLGHKNIAYVGRWLSHADFESREQGFRAGMQQALLPVRPEWIIQCDPEGKDDRATASSAFEQAISAARGRLTAIVCASDTLAIEICHSIRRHGKKVPDDYSVTGYGNSLTAQFAIPPLTTVLHDGELLGSALASSVMKLIEKQDTPISDTILPSRLMIRDTIAPRAPHVRLTAEPGLHIIRENGTVELSGIYEFEALHSGMLLDVPNAARTPGCHVWQWKRNGTTAQLWHVSHVQDGWHRIRNIGSWMFLDADSQSPDVCPVVMNPLDDVRPEYQLWKFELVSEPSTYRITNKAKGLVVDFAYGSVVSNELVIVYPWNGNQCQQWIGERVPFLTDEYEIVALHSTMALDVPDQSRAVGVVPCQAERAKTLGQRWRLLYRGGGFYQIQSMLSNLVLQAERFPAPTAKLTQNDPDSGDAQLWRLEPADPAVRSYRILNKAVEMVLEIRQGQHTGGAGLQLGQWTNGSYQQWLLYNDNDDATT